MSQYASHRDNQEHFQRFVYRVNDEGLFFDTCFLSVLLGVRFWRSAVDISSN
jgi:hypothetical protein